MPEFFITGSDSEHLDAIISTLHRHGARLVESQDVTLVPAEGNRIVPKGFYSTTNYPTQIRIGNEWIPVDNIEMDCLIVVSPDKRSAKATPMSKLQKGDLVVIGEHGVKIKPPERSVLMRNLSLWVALSLQSVRLRRQSGKLHGKLSTLINGD
jgi:hypothetical protein